MFQKYNKLFGLAFRKSSTRPRLKRPFNRPVIHSRDHKVRPQASPEQLGAKYDDSDDLTAITLLCMSNYALNLARPIT